MNYRIPILALLAALLVCGPPAASATPGLLAVVTANGLSPVIGPLISGFIFVKNLTFSSYPLGRNTFHTVYGSFLTTLAVKGTAISMSASGYLASEAAPISRIVPVDATHVFIAKRFSGQASAYCVSLVPLSEIDLTMDNWIGVAEQSATAGAPCLVMIGGGITRQLHGLKPGHWYIQTPFGIQELEANILKNNPEQRLLIIGKALAPDKLLLSYSN